MSANPRRTGVKGCRRWQAGLAALAIAWGGSALAQQVVSVPAAHLNHAEGSVAYAPLGEREWQDVQPRRLLKRGDRLWTDRGSRAEVQAGGHALRINGETQLILENVGDTATQLSVTQGSVIATVTRMNPGDSFEVGTPNLAFRARQPGDYRIDVDAKQGITRVVVASGSGVVFGEKGEALEVRSGQRLTFRARDLSRMLQPAFAAVDDFDRWAGARKRGEPTVSMPVMAAAPASAPAAPPDMGRSRTIVISGTAASLKQPAPNVAALPAPKAVPPPPVAKTAPPVAPAHAQQVALPAARPLAAAKVAAPLVPPAAGVTPAVLPPPQPQQPPQVAARPQAPAAPVPNAQAIAQAQAQAQAAALAQAQAAVQAKAAKAARVEQERRVAAAKRADDRRRAIAARRADDERRRVQARRDQEHKRQLARRAEEERRGAQARRAAEEKRLAAARKAEALKLAESRRQQLARLQDQARREEQSVQATRAQAARKADEERREDQARREEQVRREEQARREEERRQRMLAEQARRDQQRREEEVWLRQQQAPQLIQQPARPQPMGVPARRVS